MTRTTITDQVPQDSAAARARSASPIPRTLQRQPRPVRQPRRAAAASALALDRPGRDAHLCASSAPKRRAMGPRLSVARPAARRPHPAVPRRYAGLSGRLLRRGARRLRAAADQHADAAGPAAVLSVRRRCAGRGRRCRILRTRFDAEACKDTPLRHADRDQRRRAGEHAVATTLVAEQWLRELSRPSSRQPTPHRNEMAFWMYSSGSTGRPKGIVHLQHDMAYTRGCATPRHVLKLEPGRHLLLRAKDLLRLWLRQLHHASRSPSAPSTRAACPASPKPAAIFDAIAPLPADRLLRPADALHRR